MKFPKAFVVTYLALRCLIAVKGNRQHAAMKMSDDKMCQQREQGNRQSIVNRRQTDEDQMLETKFDLDKIDINDPTKLTEYTQKQTQYLSERRTLQAQHDAENQQILQENNVKEAEIDRMIQINEVQLKAVNADIDGLQQVLDSDLKGGGMD